MLVVIQRLVLAYYWPRPNESALYERIGVPFLGRYVPTGGSRFLLMPSLIKKGRPRQQVLQKFVNATMLMEIAHVVCFVLFFREMLDDYDNSRYVEAVLWVPLNVFVNVYPIMLQRFNRERALPLLNRFGTRGAVSAVS